MRRGRGASVAALLLLSGLAPAFAGDRTEGARKAQACQTCHGVDGIAKIPFVPHLAGQNEQFFVKSLKAYRSGERKDEMMSVIARTLSDRDIEDLAAYYAAIEIMVKPVSR